MTRLKEGDAMKSIYWTTNLKVYLVIDDATLDLTWVLLPLHPPFPPDGEDDLQNQGYIRVPKKDTSSRGRKVFEEIIVYLAAFVDRWKEVFLDTRDVFND